MRRVLMAAVVLTAITTGANAQTLKMDVPAGLSLSTASEPAPKKDKDSKPTGIFKDLRPGQCRATTFKAPVSSWPARGEPLVALCRP